MEDVPRRTVLDKVSKGVSACLFWVIRHPVTFMKVSVVAPPAFTLLIFPFTINSFSV